MINTKTYLFTLIILSLFILTGCDPRKRLSDEEANEVLNSASNIIMNDGNWISNYIYRYNEKYLINIEGEKFYKNADDLNNQNELQAKYEEAKNRIKSIFKDYKQNMQVTGWNDIGSYKTIFITLLYNEEQQNNDLLLNKISCRIFKDGSFYLSFEYQIDSVKYKEYIELLVDEKKLQNYKNPPNS